MKRFMSLFVILFYMMTTQSAILAAGPTSSGEPSVYDTIQDGGKKNSSEAKNKLDSKSSSIFPMFLKLIFSFLLVIGLLIVVMRFLSKRERLNQTNGPVLPLGVHPLGDNRTLQVVLIGQTIYILGVGESVSLIRTISQGEEYRQLLEGYENQAEGLSSKLFHADSNIKWTSVFRNHLQKMNLENRKE